jgi:hypothetical protein
MINDDGTVNIDPEGIAIASEGGFWIASEGAGTIGQTESRPIELLNFLFKTDSQGVIEEAITLPEHINAMQLRFGFEGVSEYNSKVYVAFQRAWGDEQHPRIGIYDRITMQWSFVFYPLDQQASQNGGWVGLSDIASWEMALSWFWSETIKVAPMQSSSVYTKLILRLCIRIK